MKTERKPRTKDTMTLIVRCVLHLGFLRAKTFRDLKRKWSPIALIPNRIVGPPSLDLTCKTREKADQVTERSPWGTFQLEVPKRVVTCFFSPGQHHVFMHAQPKPRHVDSRTLRPNSPQPLSYSFFSFKMPKTDYPIFSKYFSVTMSQLLNQM